jgi:hypothetical protein
MTSFLEDREQVRPKERPSQTKTDAVQVKVIDSAVDADRPVAPNRPLLPDLILFVALGAGVGAAFAKGSSRRLSRRRPARAGTPAGARLDRRGLHASARAAPPALKWFASRARCGSLRRC